MAAEAFEVRISKLMEQAADTIKQESDVVIGHHKRISELENRQDTMWKILQNLSKYLEKEEKVGERT